MTSWSTRYVWHQIFEVAEWGARKLHWNFEQKKQDPRRCPSRNGKREELHWERPPSRDGYAWGRPVEGAGWARPVSRERCPPSRDGKRGANVDEELSRHYEVLSAVSEIVERCTEVTLRKLCDEVEEVQEDQLRPYFVNSLKAENVVLKEAKQELEKTLQELRNKYFKELTIRRDKEREECTRVDKSAFAALQQLLNEEPVTN